MNKKFNFLALHACLQIHSLKIFNITNKLCLHAINAKITKNMLFLQFMLSRALEISYYIKVLSVSTNKSSKFNSHKLEFLLSLNYLMIGR
jgi:hypothetical protein